MLMDQESNQRGGQATYLTLHELQDKYQALESHHDLFECLLHHQSECADAESSHKTEKMEETVTEQGQGEGHSGCRCSKIGCLKLYCQCFANGRKCGPSCECTSCRNCLTNEAEIYQAKMLANFRHPGHFIGIPALTPTRRCTCKKSMCQKRYCECYSAGLKCNELCQCKDCQNGHPHNHEDNPYFCMNINHEHSMQIQVPA